MAGKNDADASKAATAKLIPMIENGAANGCPVCEQLNGLTQYLVKRSQSLLVSTTV
uniref:Pyruvate-flavodoxin oxidoreductase n=1 Tax=feces metagenome TaxID=1861841 RepID=A0A2I2K931_9ZZZZ